MNPIFASLAITEVDGQIVFDLTNTYPKISADQARSLVNFVRLYAPNLDGIGKAFKNYRAYKEFAPVAIALGLNQKIALEKVKEDAQKSDPILILIDVGGSILYRSGKKLNLAERQSGKSYCQIKMHHHYYRPNFDIFLQQLISHPRVQLAFYTSIMRKNVMPLLFKIFDMPTLSPHRQYIFEVFDQDYNVPDLGPSKKPYATKRCLTKVLEHHKCIDFGFNEHNVLMIDSELDKVRDYPLNSIVINAYDEDDVLHPTTDQSKILTTVRDYVDTLLEDCDDVQEYLVRNKPAFSLWE